MRQPNLKTLELVNVEYQDRVAREQGKSIYQIVEDGNIIAAKESKGDWRYAMVYKMPNGVSFDLLKAPPSRTNRNHWFAYGIATRSDITFTDGTKGHVDDDGIIQVAEGEKI